MTIRVQPITTLIGATIAGIDLREPLDETVVREVERALLDHGVVFFRDQATTPDQLVVFASQFGTISIPPMAPAGSPRPEVMVLDQISPKGEGADNWHSDNTFMSEPPMGSILKAVRLPAVGGDTCFANAAAAYEGLSEAMRRFVDGLHAVHDITKPMTRAIDAGIFDPAKLAKQQEQWPPVEHPVVRTHPVTGRKALYVNGNSTTKIVGLSERENALLLPFLNDHIRSPEFQCRFRWDTNSIAFWDNRTVQHFAVPDYNERRIMHRVTLTGDKPS
jgi:taurine dioxygenase